MDKKNTHNYPATRKPRDISYSKSYKIVEALGEEKLRDLFNEAGQYVVARQLSGILGYDVTPNVAHYCRKRYNLGGRNEENII